MNINKIKSYLTLKCGSKIIIYYNVSRGRIERYTGVLWKLYNNIFLLKLDNDDIKSFSYIDILTKTIKIYI